MDRQGAYGGRPIVEPLSWANAITDLKQEDTDKFKQRLTVNIEIKVIGEDEDGWFYAFYMDKAKTVQAAARRPSRAVALLLQKLYDEWRDQ
jgi:hypothetical protein